MDAIYGYQAVNVEAQSREPSSLLNWMRRMLAVRKEIKAFGRGSLVFLRPANRSPVPGLFLVGGSAYPGGGLPLVGLSAAIVADLIGPA